MSTNRQVGVSQFYYLVLLNVNLYPYATGKFSNPEFEFYAFHYYCYKSRTNIDLYGIFFIFRNRI